MKWYGEILGQLQPEKTYSHGELIGRLAQAFPDLSPSSYHWAITGMLKEGGLERRGFDEYAISDGRVHPFYEPIYTDLATELMGQVDTRFPHIAFTVFETILMNEFLNHLIAQNTVFIQAERGSSIFVFRFLQAAGFRSLMYRPTMADLALYWAKDCIVVADLISEAPLNPMRRHHITVEKMLVDMYCDKLIGSTYEKAEFPSMAKRILARYRVEKPKLLRYARRRNKEAELERFLGNS